VGYVFAGSATRLLHEMTDEPNRPFYRLGARLFLGEIPRADFSEFIEQGFHESGVVITAEAVERILDHARNVPYNVQRLAHETWEMARSGAIAPPVEPADIDRALTRIGGQEAPAHAALWRSLTSAAGTGTRCPTSGSIVASNLAGCAEPRERRHRGCHLQAAIQLDARVCTHGPV
jgi:uncharacterized protein (UPF0147 family)